VRAAAIGLLLAACAPAAAPPLAHRTPVEQPKRLEQGKRYVDRKLRIDPSRSMATRGSWELSIDRGSATLLGIEQEAPGSFTIERADREAKWTTTSTRVQKGPVRLAGDHIVLELESDVDSLYLHCWRRSLVVATAGARRVATPGRAGDCSDRGVWTPATTTRVDALVCGQGSGLDDGQESGLDGQRGSLDETLWRFLEAPGLEFVEVSDDCFQSTGLRLAK
jgi:hypothetical protein